MRSYSLWVPIMPEVACFRPLTYRDMFPVMQARWAGRGAGTRQRARSRGAPASGAPKVRIIAVIAATNTTTAMISTQWVS